LVVVICAQGWRKWLRRDLIALSTTVKNVASPLRAGGWMPIYARSASAYGSKRKSLLASISKPDARPALSRWSLVSSR
jgi:hypothetical protein